MAMSTFLSGLDQLVVDREAVDEEDGLATLAEVRGDVLFPDVGLLHVGDADEHDVGATDGFGGLIDLEALLLRGGGGLGTLVQAHDDVESAVAEVHRVGMSLGTEAEDGEGLVLEEAEIGVLVGVHFGRHGVWWKRGLLGGLLEAAGKGDGAGAGGLEDAVRADEVEEGADLVLVARELDDEGVVGDVDDLGAEEGGDLEDLGAGLLVALHLAEDELAGDVVDLLAGEVVDGDDVDQLIEGLDAAVEGGVVGDDGRGDARVGRIVGRADVEGLDVETAAGQHAGDASQDAELVFDEGGERVLLLRGRHGDWRV
jgi:hypothetical protein